jgi:hypothetical protein
MIKLREHMHVPELPVHALPVSVQKFISSAARSLNCNDDFIFISVLAATSIAIGAKTRAQVKAGWIEGCPIWAMVVGEPGSKKTPAINKGLSPIFKIQKANFQQYLEEVEKDENALMKSIVTTDATAEAVSELMAQNPNGLLCHQDEAIGFVKGMDQYKGGKGNDQEKYLSMWSQTLLMVHRKGKTPVQVDLPFYSFIGGIQVDLLENLSGLKENGFIDRFLFVFPSAVKAEHTDYELDEVLMNDYESIIQFIYASQLNSPERVLTFSDEAKKRWSEWNIEFCDRLNEPALPFYLKNALAKMAGYTIRFAIILEHLYCAELGFLPQMINLKSIDGAIALCDYFIANYNKVRGSFATSTVDKKIESTLAWLRRQKHGSADTRKVYTNRVAGVKNAQEAYELFLEMRSRGMGSMETTPDGLGGAKRTYVFRLNSSYLKPLNFTTNA